MEQCSCLQVVGLDVGPQGMQDPSSGGLLDAQHSGEGGRQAEALRLVVQLNVQGHLHILATLPPALPQ